MNNSKKAVEVTRMMYAVIDRHISPKMFDASERQNLKKQIVGELLSGLIKAATPVLDDPNKSWTTTPVSDSKNIKLPPASKFPSYSDCVDTISGSPYNLDSEKAKEYCLATSGDSDTNQPSKSGRTLSASSYNIPTPKWALSVGDIEGNLPNAPSNIKSAAMAEEQRKIRAAMDPDLERYIRRVPRRPDNSIRSGSTTSNKPAWAVCLGL